MKIQNILSATVFFPYAGITPTRGRDLISQEISSELEPARFFDPRLQLDWRRGKVKIILTKEDTAALGIVAKDVVKQANIVVEDEERIANIAKQMVEEQGTEQVVTETKPKPPEEAPVVTSQVEEPVVEELQEEEAVEVDAPESLATLNKPKAKKATRKRSTKPKA